MAHKYQIDLDLNYSNLMSGLSKAGAKIDGLVEGINNGVRLDVALDPKSIAKLQSQINNLIDIEPILGVGVALSVDKSQIALFERELEDITTNIQKKTYDKLLSKQAEALISQYKNSSFKVGADGDDTERRNYFEEQITQFTKLVNTYKQFGAKFEDRDPALAYLEQIAEIDDYYYDLIEEVSENKLNIFDVTSRKSIEDSMDSLKRWNKEIKSLAEQYNVTEDDINEMLGTLSQGAQRATGGQAEVSDAAEKAGENIKGEGQAARATTEDMQKLLEVLDKVTASLSEISEKIKSLNIKELGDIKQDINITGIDDLIGKIGTLSDKINGDLVESIRATNISIDAMSEKLGNLIIPPTLSKGVETASEGLRNTISDSTSYVSKLKESYITIADLNEDIRKYPEDAQELTQDLDKLISKYPELEKFKDVVGYDVAKKFTSSDEWNEFLATLPKAQAYLESIGYEFKEVDSSKLTEGLKDEIQLAELLTEKFDAVVKALNAIIERADVLKDTVAKIEPVNNYYGGNGYFETTIDESTIDNIRKLVELIETISGNVTSVKTSFETLATTIQQLPISKIEELLGVVTKLTSDSGDVSGIEKLKNQLVDMSVCLERLETLQKSVNNGSLVSGTESASIKEEAEKLGELKIQLDDVAILIKAKSDEFEKEATTVKTVVDQEVGYLNGLKTTIGEVADSVSSIGKAFADEQTKISGYVSDVNTAIKTIDPKGFSWIKNLQGVDSDKLTNIADALKTFATEVKTIDLSGSAFINDIKELTTHSKELENLAKIVSKSKKQINAAKGQTDQGRLEGAYKKRLALQRKINDQNIKILKNNLDLNVSDETRKKNNEALRQTLDKYSASLTAVQASIDKYEKSLGKSAVRRQEYNDLITQGNRDIAEQRKLLEASNVEKRSDNLDTLKKKYQDLSNSIAKFTDESKYNESVTNPFTNILNDITSAINNLNSMNVGDAGFDKKIVQLSDGLTDINLRISQNKELTKQADAIWMDSFKVEGLKTRITTFADKVLAGNIKNRIVELGESINTNAQMSKQEFKEVSSLFEQYKEEAVSSGKIGTGFLDLIGKKLKGVNAQLIAYFFSWMDIIRYIRTGVDAIREIDYALVDLRKTTTMSSSDLNQFYYDANDVAKQMGITTAQVVDLASSFSRLGYSSKEAATEMAKQAAKFALISPGMDTETAQTGMVSIQKAFRIANNDIEREILDNINIIGNNFATSNDEIIAGLERGASAMAVANNSLEETIALFAAGQEITQDAEKMGTALRTKNCALHIEICA